MSSLYQKDAVDLLDGYRTGQCSPREVLTETLNRIETFQPRLNAFCFRNVDVEQEAFASEQRWLRNQPLGPLDGVPIIIKDNMAVRGMPASWGNAELATRLIDRDELPVERLRKAGAVILGKGNTPEFAVEGYTANARFGVTSNPFDARLTPGGSSGAVAAAVASGQATLGVGTDGGGSIRRPAAYCGLVGLKPGLGHAARAHGLPQVLLDFEVIGPMTRSVRDARLMDAVLQGSDRRDPMSRRRIAADSARPLRVLYVPRFAEQPCDPVILTAVGNVVASLSDCGFQVSEGGLPLDLDGIMAHWSRVAEIGLSHLFATDKAVADSANDTYKAMAARGAEATASELITVQDLVGRLRVETSELFTHWDLIVTPATAAMPWPANSAYPTLIDGQEVGPRGHALYSGWVNAAGHPAISVPAGASDSGMPIGLQLVGDLGSESLLLDVAEQIEALSAGFQWPSQFA